jgi:hypothetical protein
MTNINLALYYPSMEFQNTDWLKGMLLFWDGIRRIVPASYQPNDNDEVKAFINEGIIDSIDPGKDAVDIANNFIIDLEHLYNDAAALYWIKKPQEFKEHYRIHPAKIDARLRDILSSREISLATKDWLQVSEEFGRYYMFYLANAMAEKRGLAKITDFEEAWTASSYFDYNGMIEKNPVLASDKQIITLILKDFIPANIQEIPTNSIISFRENYRDERKRFIESIKTFVTNISSISDTKTISDAINEYKKDVESSLTDFRKTLARLKCTSLIGIKTISFPIGVNIPTLLGNSNFEYIIASNVIGLSLGFLTSYMDYQGKKKSMAKECDFSYLYFMSGSLDNWYDGNSLMHHLYRNLHEFIDD